MLRKMELGEVGIVLHTQLDVIGLGNALLVMNPESEVGYRLTQIEEAPYEITYDTATTAMHGLRAQLEKRYEHEDLRAIYQCMLVDLETLLPA